MHLSHKLRGMTHEGVSTHFTIRWGTTSGQEKRRERVIPKKENLFFFSRTHMLLRSHTCSHVQPHPCTTFLFLGRSFRARTRLAECVVSVSPGTCVHIFKTTMFKTGNKFWKKKKKRYLPGTALTTLRMSTRSNAAISNAASVILIMTFVENFRRWRASSKRKLFQINCCKLLM